MPAPKTSVGKKARTTQPQFLGTSHVRHTGSTIMTVAVENLPKILLRTLEFAPLCADNLSKQSVSGL